MRVRIIHADCLEYLPKLQDEEIHLLFSCLPAAREAQIDPERLMQLVSALRPLRTAVFLPADKFSPRLWMAARSSRLTSVHEEIGVKLQRTGFYNCAFRPLTAHEKVLIAQDRPKSATYHPELSEGKPYSAKSARPRKPGQYNGVIDLTHANAGTRQPTTVFEYRSERRRTHENGQPLSLSDRYIKRYTDPGQTVLDLTMGSATTLISAAKLGRSAIGIEKDPARYEQARARLGVLGIRFTEVK